MARPIQVRTKVSAIFRDGAPVRQAEDLIPAAVGQDGPLPADELMKPPTTRDELIPGTQQQVIRVGEHDLRAGVFEVWMTKGFDRTLCADGHEGRCLKDAVGRVALAKTRCTVRRSQAKAELTHVKIISVKKLRVGVIYGGRSGEHEVSVASAASIFRHLDPQRYAAVPIRIEKNGH